MNKKTTAKIDKIIEERQQTKEALLKRIETAKADIEKANAAMDKATGNDDETAYIKASDKKRFNESVIETCEQRIAELKKSISEEEYNSITTEIKTEINKSIEKSETKAADLIIQLYTIAAELDKEIKEGNQAAARLANVCGKNPFEVDYNAINSELLYLKRELQKRKINAFNNGKKATIYSKIPAVDILRVDQ